MERALLVINRAAGTGQDDSVVARLSLLFKEALRELAQVRVDLVSDHAAARASATRFIAESEAPALVVAGGGGGTLRAVIEAICDSAGLQRARVGALRLGSGNVLAKQFGVPDDPITALHGLLNNLKDGRTAPCCVMRCQTWTSSGDSEIHHAVTLGGLGQFGRIPSDLARWHASLRFVHKSAARLLGIERLTNVEYGVALFIRSLRCMLFPNRVETVETEFLDQKQSLRLLSGVVMNFPIAGLPFEPAITAQDEAILVYLIPLRGRLSPLSQVRNARPIKIEKNQRLEIRFIDREYGEFFLDEDPVLTYKRLTLEVAGSIAFVPGPNYRR